MFSFNSLLDSGFINYWDRLWNPVRADFLGEKMIESGEGVLGEHTLAPFWAVDFPPSQEVLACLLLLGHP